MAQGKVTVPDAPLTTGINYRCTLLFGGGPPGYSENYWVNVNGGADPQRAAATSVARIAAARREKMPSDISIIGLRVSQEGLPGKVLIAAPPSFSLGVGTVLFPAGPLTQGWMARLATAENTVDNRIVMRGWTANDLNFVVQNGLRVKPPTRIVNLEIVLREIIANEFVTDGSVCNFVIKSFIRPDALNPVVPFQNVVVLTGGRISIQIPTSAATGFLVGQMLSLKVARRKCLKGLSGLAQLVNKEAAGAVTTLFLKKSLCCGADILEGVVGSVYPQVTAYWAVRQYSILGQGNRKPGRAFFVPAGRQSARCC